MAKEFKAKWEQVPAYQRLGLTIASVDRLLVTRGKFSPNERSNLAKFGFICVGVALVALAEVYFFAHYALGVENVWLLAVIALAWAGVTFSFDRTLFLDTLDKAKLRMAFIVLGTIVFSLGFSVYISDKQVTDIITEENRLQNEKIDKSLLANLQLYQDRYDEAVASQTQVSRDIIKGDKTAEVTGQVTRLQEQAAQVAGDTTREGKAKQKALNNAMYTINRADQRSSETQKGLRETMQKAVTAARVELDSQKVRYQRAYDSQRVPPDYSATNKTLTLIKNYLKVGWMHVFIVFLVAFIEGFPLLMRFVYRNYDAVQYMIGLNNTPDDKRHGRIDDIEAGIEQGKRERAERERMAAEARAKEGDDGSDNENPFRQAW